MILGLILLVLKLSGTVDWAWWIVLLPFYVGYLIIAGAILLAFVLWASMWTVSLLTVLFYVVFDFVADAVNFLRDRDN